MFCLGISFTSSPLTGCLMLMWGEAVVTDVALGYLLAIRFAVYFLQLADVSILGC